jgi:Right handed beta helix region
VALTTLAVAWFFAGDSFTSSADRIVPPERAPESMRPPHPLGTWPKGAGARGTMRVPTYIDATGRTDVTRQLQDFFSRVPDFYTITFSPYARYRVEGTLELMNRRGLVFQGNSAVIFASSRADGQRAHWRVIRGAQLVFRDLTVAGASKVGGTPYAFVSSLQWQHGFDLRGVTAVEIDDVTITDVYGDCVYVGLGIGTRALWSSGVHLHDSVCRRNGRQGVAITAGQDVTVDHTSFDATGLMTFDIEPNGEDGGADRVSIVNNWVAGGFREFFGVVGLGSVSNVVVSHNTLIAKALTVLVATPGQRRTGIMITGNTSDLAYRQRDGAPMQFEGVDSLTVTGNVQSLVGPNMTLARVEKSCSVNVSRNHAPGGTGEVSLRPYDCPGR